MMRRTGWLVACVVLALPSMVAVLVWRDNERLQAEAMVLQRQVDEAHHNVVSAPFFYSCVRHLRECREELSSQCLP